MGTLFLFSIVIYLCVPQTLGAENKKHCIPLFLGVSNLGKTVQGDFLTSNVSWDCSHLKGKGMGRDLLPSSLPGLLAGFGSLLALGQMAPSAPCPMNLSTEHNMAACYTRANKTRTGENEPGQDDSASLLQPNLGSLFTLEAVATRPSSRSRGGDHTG